MTFLTNGERVALRVAAADQKHTVRKMLDLVGDAGRMTSSRHPWITDLGERVLQGLTDRSANLCPHINMLRGPEPMFAMLSGGPLEIQCRLCLATRRQRLGPVDDSTCDRCSVYTRHGLSCGMLPIGPLLLMFGLCRPCATGMDLT